MTASETPERPTPRPDTRRAASDLPEILQLDFSDLRHAFSAGVNDFLRAPQFGLQLGGGLAGGLRFSLQTEATRFELPDREGSAAEPTGWRGHVLGSLSRTWGRPGAWLTPRLSFNAATYALDQALADGRKRASRVVPTASVEGASVRSTRAASPAWSGKRTVTREPGANGARNTSTNIPPTLRSATWLRETTPPPAIEIS